MRPQRRRAFTLIELLIVMVILAVLIGLLLPAIMRAVSTAKDAACAAEINAMAQALADFRSQYGEYPPSRVILCEDGVYSGTFAPAGTLPLMARSAAILRKFWPKMTISTVSTIHNAITGAIPGSFYDFNGNGVNDSATPYILQGHQCLTFFLGGVPYLDPKSNQWSMTGYYRNPSNPFYPATAAGAATASTSRTAQLFEFKSTRLAGYLAISSGTLPFPGYTDNMGEGNADSSPPDAFYAYFSAYGGVGYDPDDVNFVEPDDAGSTSTGVLLGIMSTNAATPNGTQYTTAHPYVSSPSPNPYVTSEPIPTSGGAIDTTSVNSRQPRIYLNPQSFQIISPGRDRLYGMGGQYLQGKAAPLPYNSVINSAVTGQAYDAGIRIREQDNISNFAPSGMY